MRKPFRIRVVHGDGEIADYDVTRVEMWAWDTSPLELHTENGLVIQSRIAHPNGRCIKCGGSAADSQEDKT